MQILGIELEPFDSSMKRTIVSDYVSYFRLRNKQRLYSNTGTRERDNTKVNLRFISFD